MTTDRVTELEIRYAHQERLLEELSLVLYEQRRVVEELESRVADLERRLREMDEPTGGEEAPPPHY
ncbi:MAG: SlyX family protein [Polyangiaceae bacterium]